MRVATAYFVGAGTVVVAIAAGLGGGLLLGNIMSPQQPKYPSSEVTRLEQRASQQPIQAMNSASQPVPYVTAPQTTASVAGPQPQSPQQAQPQPQQPQAQQASTQPAEAKQQSETNATAKPEPVAVAPQLAAAPPPATTEQTATRERAAPDDAYAKARDADLKRDARRAEESRRKAERRQQWAERRKPRKGDDLDDVEASVRQSTEPRSFFGREESRPVFGGDQGFGRIRVFDND